MTAAAGLILPLERVSRANRVPKVSRETLPFRGWASPSPGAPAHARETLAAPQKGLRARDSVVKAQNSFWGSSSRD